MRATSPALVYHDRAPAGNAGIAYAISHELGHNLGLRHQGTGLALGGDPGYYGGHGSGATSWAPIMGNGFSRSVAHWARGEYHNANNKEDAIEIIAGRLGYRGELGAVTLATAPAITPLASGTATGKLGATGVIRHSGFSHYYSINPASAGSVTFTLDPARHSDTGTIFGGADLKLELLDADGIVTDSHAPANALNASLTKSLAADKRYYVRVSSEGTGNPDLNPPSGYTAYGSIGQYTLATNLAGAPPPAGESSLAITPTAKEAEEDEGVFAIDVLCAKSWTATSNAPWLAIDAGSASGYGNGMIIVTHNANNTTAPRRGVVTVTSGTAYRLCEVSQPVRIPFATALNNNLVWESGGNDDDGTPIDKPWTTQTLVTHDGKHAARSGIIFGVTHRNAEPYSETGQSTWLQTTVTGKGTLNFWWKVDSEAEDSNEDGTWGDICYFYINGLEEARSSGKKDWASRSFEIDTTGTHTLKWVYHKDPYLSVGADAAWLDEVTWTPAGAILLKLTPDTKPDVPATSGYFNLTVDANVPWEARSNVSWLVVSPISGTNGGALTITHFPNTETTARTGVITLTGGGTTATGIVTQFAAPTGGGGGSSSSGGGALSLWILLALCALFGLRSVRNKK
jgi:hypothetical protein